jgi:multimeric flavodoxin WrbA
MQALLLNGAYEAGDATDNLAEPIAEHLARRNVATRSFVLRDKNVAFCAGCFGCWTHNGGKCVIDDDGRDLADLARARDLIILLTPVVFGGYGWMLKKGLDRLLPDLAPYFLAEEAGEAPQEFAALLGVGVMTEEDPTEASMFLSLLKRNAANYHSPSCASLVVRAGIDHEQFGRRLERAMESLEAPA